MIQSRLIQGDAAMIPLADHSVDLIFGSPPYCDARTYGIGAQRGCSLKATLFISSLFMCSGQEPDAVDNALKRGDKLNKRRDLSHRRGH